MREEHQRLQAISEWYSNRTGFYGQLVQFGFRTLEPYFRPGNVLEMGSADGQMTEFLATRFSDISIVDGSATFVEAVLKRLPSAKGYVALFEEFEPPEQYDNIVMAHILEHVADPVSILRRSATWLTPSGRIFIIVPNANSIHRQVGVKMGLLEQTTSLHEDDLRVGHRRVYEPSTLLADIAAAGLTMAKRGGIFFKPLSNSQIEETWTEQTIEGFYELGKDYPDLASELFAVCHP